MQSHASVSAGTGGTAPRVVIVLHTTALPCTLSTCTPTACEDEPSSIRQYDHTVYLTAGPAGQGLEHICYAVTRKPITLPYCTACCRSGSMTLLYISAHATALAHCSKSCATL
eukprot:2304-Heterococcus_DN1.PRE.2